VPGLDNAAGPRMLRPDVFEGITCMRRALSAILVSATLALAPTSAFAQAFPNKALTMVVPFAAGGPTDVVARIVTEKMSSILGQQFVIENIGGAGGMTGAAKAAKAAPDGYTMVMGTVGTHAQGQTLYAKPAYNAVDDFAPVALIAEIPLAVVTRKDIPANTLQEFIAHTKANQKTMNYASSGAGAAVHIGCVTLNLAMGVDVAHVPYRGSSAALQDIIGGRVDYICEVISGAVSHAQSGTVKVLAVMDDKRSHAMPDLKTTVEQGLNATAYTWNAIFAPKGTPDDVVQKLNKAAIDAYNDPVVKKKLEDLGYHLARGERATPKFLGDFVKAEIKKWETPIKAAGIKVE
jgi:tripartite-type tricarboxylate transporter receptor subunit TctC